MKELKMHILEQYEKALNEALPAKEIDPVKFPNPATKNDPEFFKKGKKDGDITDDVVSTKKVGIPAKQLKPSQDAVYLGKALGMAVGGVEGGDLGAIISKDNRILDGHHRWAATIFNNPSAKVLGTVADLSIGDLIPVLRQAGDAIGNKRGLPPKGGDVNIFSATIKDVEDAIYKGINMDPKFYDKDKSIAWYDKIGPTEIQKRLAIINRVGPPAGAPPRADMPKIEPNQVSKVAKALGGGNIDVRAPYANESYKMKYLPTFESFVNESKHEAKNVTIYFKGGATTLTVNMTDDEIHDKYPKGKVMSYGPGRSKKSGPIKRIEIKSVNESNNESFVSEAYVEIEGIWSDNSREMMPGGSPQEIKDAYSLTVSDEGNGMYKYSGDKDDIKVFLDNYGLEDLEIVENQESVTEAKSIEMSPEDAIEFFKDGIIPIGLIFNIREKKYTRSGYGLTSTYFEVVKETDNKPGLYRQYIIKFYDQEDSTMPGDRIETRSLNGSSILDYLFDGYWYKNSEDFKKKIFVKDLGNKHLTPLKKLYK